MDLLFRQGYSLQKPPDFLIETWAIGEVLHATIMYGITDAGSVSLTLDCTPKQG